MYAEHILVCFCGGLFSRLPNCSGLYAVQMFKWFEMHPYEEKFEAHVTIECKTVKVVTVTWR